MAASLPVVFHRPRSASVMGFLYLLMVLSFFAILAVAAIGAGGWLAVGALVFGTVVILLPVVWLLGLVPRAIEIRSNGDVVFRSRLRTVVTNASEIHTIERSRGVNEGNRMNVKWGVGSQIHLFQYNYGPQFIAVLKSLNPNIEIR